MAPRNGKKQKKYINQQQEDSLLIAEDMPVEDLEEQESIDKEGKGKPISSIKRRQIQNVSPPKDDLGAALSKSIKYFVSKHFKRKIPQLLVVAGLTGEEPRRDPSSHSLDLSLPIACMTDLSSQN
ncbi:hypothetical protein NDU88_004634 [Pleurodeles waltl]|uniref:Uncharacterized protein n=1 Tax=Pleurodeles waltl TaxID=8319 RepID=A0AAV7M8R9_PLEWA|nr:hypothetical protein NDU88_004634 [Pleurodeles waltl]